MAGLHPAIHKVKPIPISNNLVPPIEIIRMGFLSF
jgi:hypothetical protein